MKTYHVSAALKREFWAITGTWLMATLVLGKLFVHITHLLDADPPFLTPWPLLISLVLVYVTVIHGFYRTWYVKMVHAFQLHKLNQRLHKHYGGNVPHAARISAEMLSMRPVQQIVLFDEGYCAKDHRTVQELAQAIGRANRI